MAKVKTTSSPATARWWTRMREAYGRISTADKLKVVRGTMQLMLLGGVIAGGVWTLDQMEASVHRLMLRQAPPRLSVMAPAWMLDTWVQSLGEDAGLRAGDQLADADLVPRLAEDLAGNPWVAQVQEVRKYPDGQIVVNCRFRKPLAFVKSGPVFYLVDKEAVVLKVASADELDTLGLLRIQGTRELAPAPGTAWPGKDLPAGLRLAELLAKQPYRPQLDSIDVSNYAGQLNDRQPHLVVATNVAGRKIRWGRAPGEEEGKENTADRKLNLLRWVYEREHRVDANRDFVDVRFDRYAVDVPEPAPKRPSLRG